jgi:cobalt-zinc-cadmium efflux system outer membrane protein
MKRICGYYGYLKLVDAQHEYLAVQATLIEADSAHTLRPEIERLTTAPLTTPTP